MRFLTPTRHTDVFATFGTGNKSHVVKREWVELNASGGYTVTARCGRKGRKVHVQGQHSLPANMVERHAVCQDCREFARGTDG